MAKPKLNEVIQAIEHLDNVLDTAKGLLEEEAQFTQIDAMSEDELRASLSPQAQ